MATATEYLKNTGRTSKDGGISELLIHQSFCQLNSWLLEIPVPNIPEPEATEPQNIPTCPVTVSAWSDDAALNGWSARMFLHQLLTTSRPHWNVLDSERLLSAWTPFHIRDRAVNEISLSAVIKPAGKASEKSFMTSRTVEGIIRRAWARGRSFRLLLRIEQDTIPMIVTFGTRQNKSSEYWTVKSGKPLPDSLKAGLLDHLKRHMPQDTGIQ